MSGGLPSPPLFIRPPTITEGKVTHCEYFMNHTASRSLDWLMWLILSYGITNFEKETYAAKKNSMKFQDTNLQKTHQNINNQPFYKRNT